MYIKRRRFRRLRRAVRFALITVLSVIALYVAYVFLSYYRLPDSSEQHSNNTRIVAQANKDYTIATWNLGFGAYSRDFSFFMDGGEESRARSAQAVLDNIGRANGVLLEESPDFMLLQEVDRDATRSWHIDEAELVRRAFPDMQTYYAQNYDSPYLLYPLKMPHGAAKSGLLTLASLDIYRSERRSLPVETGVMKLLDLDRCFSICRVPTADGHELCLYNLHLSAYTSDGKVTAEQLRMLTESMREEYEQGNYVVGGGDFNRDLLGDSEAVFGVPAGGANWAQPVDTALFGDGLALVTPSNDPPVPSCRNCDTGYVPGQTFVVVVDGFIVSDNVEAVDCRVIDDGFEASDHNPVRMTFRLREDGGERQ